MAFLVAAGCGALPPGTPLEKDTHALAAQVAKEVSVVRDLPLEAEVRFSVKDKEALSKELRERIEKEWTERDSANERALKAFGLLPTDFDLKRFVEELLLEQLAGYYDAEKKEYCAIEEADRSDEERLVVLAHELVHAISDQHFDLKSGEEARKDDHDRSLAYEALVEGDAMLACMDYLLWRLGRPTSMAQPGRRMLLSLIPRLVEAEIKGDKDADSKILREAPRMISKELLFAYLEGANFVNALRSEFGWKAVNAAYLDPPESTEQILDPSKYIDRRDRPVKIRIAAPPEGMKAVFDDTLGMLGIRVLFEEANVQPSDASGWDGDRYVLWEKDGREVLAWVSAWDSEADAKDFEAACGLLYARRHGAKGFAVVRVVDHVAAVTGLPGGEAISVSNSLLEESTFERAPDDQEPESFWSHAIRFPVAARRLDRVFELSLLGGMALEARDHEGGHRSTLAKGFLARTENNPDRTLISFVFGLLSVSVDRTQQYGRGGLDLVSEFQHHGPSEDGRWGVDLLLKSVSVCSSRARSGIELFWGAFRFHWGEQVEDGEHVRLLFIPVGW